MIFGGRSFSGRERHCAFLNTGAGTDGDDSPRFACVSATSGLDLPDDGRALAVVDWDHDGDLDVWISNRNAPRLRLMRNDAAAENHFLAIHLQGNGSTTNRDAIGARVEVHFRGPGQRPLVKTLRAGEGFLSQSTRWLHFGLGAATDVDRVTVRWPAGEAEEFGDVKADGRYHLVQGSGTATRPPGTSPRTLAIEPGAPRVTPPSPLARIPLAYRLPMLQFRYRQADGSPRVVRFDSGRPTLITLWASWCRPCLGEMQELTERGEEIRAAGIDVLALSVDGLKDDGSTFEAAAEVARRMQFPFPLGRAEGPLLSAMESMHHRQIPMRRPLPLPASFLVDARGRLAVIYKGPLAVVDLLADAKDSGGDSRRRFLRAAPLAGRAIDHPKIELARRRVETLIRFNLATDLERAGRLDEAARHYRGVLELTPGYAEVRNNLGSVLARLNVFSEARDQLQQAVALKPDLDLAHNNLGSLMLQLGDLPAAVDSYRRAVRLAPGHAGYRYNLGFALEQQGQTAQARRQYQRALEIDPRHAQAAAGLKRLRVGP